MVEPAPSLARLLERHRGALVRLVERHGSGLLRYETAEDLVQGVHLRAIEIADRFEYRGDKEFFAWIAKIARHHIANRHEYWSAMRRNAGKLLRITLDRSQTRSGTRGVEPAGAGRGPSTVAARREEAALAMKALSVLFPRDRELLEGFGAGLSVEETAERLGLSYEAAKRARQRAIERFRKTFELLLARGRGGAYPRAR
jgi:RNA polymerase sigma factor (sigma-70 family)